MIVQLIEDVNEIKKIMNDPLIYQMANGVAGEAEDYTTELKDLGFKFLGLYQYTVLIGVINIRPVTKKCLEIHTNILPQFHKMGLGKQAQEEGIAWVRENTKHTSMMTTVPGNCFHILKFMQDNDWEVTGLLKDAIIYKNELVNLHIFQKEV